MWQEAGASSIIDLTMFRPTRPGPVRVRDVLAAALPELAGLMLQESIRRDWGRIAGPDISRRSQPGGLRMGVLDVTVDNSAWLHELTLRSRELLEAVQVRHGSRVASLRFSLGKIAAGPGPPASQHHPVREIQLGSEDARLVETMVAPVADPELAASLRRLLTKDLSKKFF